LVSLSVFKSFSQCVWVSLCMSMSLCVCVSHNVCVSLTMGSGIEETERKPRQLQESQRGIEDWKEVGARS